ncbi:MAG TPA: type II secretion system F family protein [Bryobacteraceae bacterium]|jgi:tight adherence protein B|nr:type II secretion system F family protein [Bryobacteraceae bacterium]
MPPLLFFLFFCILAIVLVATAFGLHVLESQRKKQVTGILRTLEGKPRAEEGSNILLDPPNPDNLLQRLAAGLNLKQTLENTLLQSGLNWSLNQLLTGMGIAAAAGVILGLWLNLFVFWPLSSLLCGAALGALPYAYVRFKRQRRMAAFEEQFPEALDFLARSMRAGHAFSVSLEMLGAESPEPLGQEFRTLFNEQNLGAPMEVAFENMLRRFPLVDVRFFASSVMLQKQTGGNLSEILLRLAYVIRERVRLKGQVRAISAHGRLTAGILTAMPIVMMVALLFVAPGYLQGMARDPDGKYMILAAIASQFLGYYFIRKIIRIKI